MSNIIEAIEREYMKKEVPAISVGDSVKVYVKVVEGSRERLQAFEGIVAYFADNTVASHP